MNQQVEFKGRKLLIPTILFFIALIIIFATALSITEGTYTYAWIGVLVIGLLLALSIYGFLPKKLILNEEGIEYWIGGRERFKTSWEDVRRITFGRTPHMPGPGGTPSIYLTVDSKQGKLSLDSETHFSEGELRSIFETVKRVLEGNPDVDIEDESGRHPLERMSMETSLRMEQR